MLAIYLTAMPCARRATNALTKRIGGYNLFWRVHGSWKLVYVLLLLHSPQRLWIWLFFPAVMMAVDRVLLAHRQRPYIALQKVRLLSHDVINLNFRIPQGFSYEAGQYILLGWRGEWHPFTLTSAPEENSLSVHIRASNSLDWCSALRRRLTVDAPAAAARKLDFDGEPFLAPRAVAGTTFEYDTCTNEAGEVYSRPCLIEDSFDMDEIAQERPVMVAVNSPRKSTKGTQKSKTGCAQSDDSVVLQLSGPFGAPAQKVWQFDTIMIVGSGIGVTPFASILRSVQLRAQQRDAILSASSSAPKELLEKVVTVPLRVYFYWIVRSQEELRWFGDLLAAAARGPAQDIIEVNVFMTGEVELSQVEPLTCTTRHFCGRPNWGRIFKENRARHTGEHVGVFLCGSPAIGKELSAQSIKHSDAPNSQSCTRFTFYKEYF
jgi:NADPH oxidase